MNTIHSSDLENYTLSAISETPANSQQVLVDFPGDREIMQITAKAHAARGSYVANMISNFVMGITNGLSAWNNSRIAREHLATLGDHLLDDIGIKRADIDTIVATPVRTELVDTGMIRRAVKCLAANLNKYHRPAKISAKPYSKATSRNTNVVRNWFTAVRRAA